MNPIGNGEHFTEDEVSIADAPASTLRRKADRKAALSDLADWPEADIVERTVAINRPRMELYEFWRNFENLPRFMENLRRVTVHDATRSHWAVEGPGGEAVEWDAIVVDDQPGELIAWRSAPGADVRNEGRITFEDAGPGRGTAVSALILYDAPLGAAGKLLAKLMQKEPGVQTRRELRRFKQLMETGEIATSQSPRGGG